MQVINIIIGCFSIVFFIPLWLAICLFKPLFTFDVRSRKPRLVWGPVPIINNKYWSDAFKDAGYESITLMSNYFSSIHSKNVFDKYIYQFIPFLDKIKNRVFRKVYSFITPYFSFTYSILRFDIFHHHFTGGFLWSTPFWRLEAYLLKLAGCKTVITPFGWDCYRYSLMEDISWKHVLLMSFPDRAKKESVISKRLNYWNKHADAIITGFLIDAMTRWDVLPYIEHTIDCNTWRAKTKYSENDGTNGAVKIIHSPNHRGIKGTEFILNAIEELKSEGLQIELILLEKIQNEIVKQKMQEADILAEQLIQGYGMNAIEGMASGLPVLSNLENEVYTRVFRRYSYLNECPVLSACPENIKDNLRILVAQPRLREELGRAGRQYAEKYHSQQTAVYMFGKIYDKIWYGKEVDLLNLFHPLKSEYSSRTPKIKHPLYENKLRVI